MDSIVLLSWDSHEADFTSVGSFKNALRPLSSHLALVYHFPAISLDLRPNAVYPVPFVFIELWDALTVSDFNRSS